MKMTIILTYLQGANGNNLQNKNRKITDRCENRHHAALPGSNLSGGLQDLY